MIKFVDLNTGYLYDGESPYIHWFPGEQSTDLIYTHKICLISSSTNIDVELDSEVFNLIDTKKISDTSTYKDIISKKITIVSLSDNIKAKKTVIINSAELPVFNTAT